MSAPEVLPCALTSWPPLQQRPFLWRPLQHGPRTGVQGSAVAGVTVHNGATSASTKVAVAVASGICAGVGSLASSRGTLEGPNLEGPISSSGPGNLAGLISSSR